MKIYISLPISGRDIDAVRAEINMAKVTLKELGYSSVSPLEIEHKSTDYYTILGEDITEILRCDGIYLCKGWVFSNGCNTEYEIAKQWGKKILSYDDIKIRQTCDSH